MSSRIISGSRTAEDVVRAYLEKRGKEPEPTPPRPVPQPSPRPPVASLDHLVLRDIRCVNAAGNAFEEYPVLHVAKDIERQPNGSQRNFTPYQGVVHFEGKGLFLPSTALTCNILAYLFKHKDDPAVAAVLNQYKDKGNGTGWHAQNTLIDWGNNRIIHYPHDDDFPSHGGSNNINASGVQRVFLPFDKSKQTGLLRRKETLRDASLEEGLKSDVIRHFMRQYTGLEDPSILVEIGKYFGRPTRGWFPSEVENFKETRAAWVGCYDNDFDLVTYNYLSDVSAARGVREP